MLNELRSFSRNAALFLVSVSISSVGTGIFNLVFNIYVTEGLHYSEYFLGVLLSASSLSAALFALPAGILGDRVGRKRCIALGTTIIAVSMGGLIWFTSQPILVVMNALFGFGSTLNYVSFAPFMMENAAQKERVHLFSVEAALNILGYTLGAYLGGMFPSLVNGDQTGALRITLFVGMLLCFTAILPLLMLEEKKKKVLFSKRIVVSGSLLKRFIITNVLIGFGAGLIVPFFNIFFRVRMQASMEVIGLIFALANVTMGIATFVAAPLASRWGKVRSIVMTELGSLPFLLMIAYSSRLELVTLGFIARGALMNMGNPISSAFMMENLKEEERATVNGIVMAGWNGSWAVSNVVAGNLMSRGMYGLPFLITSALYAVSSALYYLFFRSLENPRRMNPVDQKQET
ncbi:MAG: MFS transporter [Theionarchaea archaeon]|nr:MFS transporter [Theionarchaea archaeon]MBU7001915.1 MFS transporter [Theionarchaea archaeon]MBU7020402.1 MFS transporter [Theionarchaea archaeon]MBU7035491.1 MFS transporter [Theionarchaea archaeon]MBU7041114.1 MFS transporter [Theionarchaea archaeon]